MTKALLIPAYNTKPATIVDLGGPPDHLEKLQELVGGYIERFQHDADADMWMNEEGRVDGLPLNRRATSYILAGSERAKSGETKDNEEWFSVYGNVVLPGLADGDRDITDVPDRLIQHFGPAPEQSRGAEM